MVVSSSGPKCFSSPVYFYLEVQLGLKLDFDVTRGRDVAWCHFLVTFQFDKSGRQKLIKKKLISRHDRHVLEGAFLP